MDGVVNLKDFENKFRVFFVTVMRIDDDKIVRQRCWGYFLQEEDARACVEENWTDIFELDYYNYALIEQVGEATLGQPYRKVGWYCTSYDYDSEGYATGEPRIFPAEEPKFLNRIVMFCYG
jgi:hypothetical protein